MRNRFEDEGYRGEWDRDRDHERTERGASLGQDRERHLAGFDRHRDEPRPMMDRGQHPFEHRDESSFTRGQNRSPWARRDWDEGHGGARAYEGTGSRFGGNYYGGPYAQQPDRFRGSVVDSHLSQPGYYGERWGESRFAVEHDRERERGGGMGREGEGFGERMMHGLRDGVRSLFGKTAKGPKGYKRSDERIHEDVCDRLSHLSVHADVDASDVEVTVKDAEVTLTGSVPERRWKHMIEDTADHVHGVKDVHNQIKVRRQNDVTGTSISSSTQSQASEGSQMGQSGQSGPSGMSGGAGVDNGSRRNMPQRS
jgi:hypothetical protein